MPRACKHVFAHGGKQARVAEPAEWTFPSPLSAAYVREPAAGIIYIDTPFVVLLDLPVRIPRYSHVIVFCSLFLTM